MTTKTLAALLAASTALAACTTVDPYTGEQKLSNTAGGALIGAVAGTAGGLVFANAADKDSRKAALIGAGIGALAGGAVGAYMDNQETELRAQLQGTGVSVTRRGDRIILNMPSNITFAVDQDRIQPRFHSTLDSVAIVLRKFDRTLVDVTGHTDADGSDDYNQDLSERRALSVASYLSRNGGVDQRRFYVDGLGEEEPIASNASAAGKAENRRVEIELSPIG